MAFLEKLQYFLKSIFSPNDPEFIKNQKIKSLEIELLRKYPNAYKKGFVQSCIADSFFELYKLVDFFREILDFIQVPEKVLAKKRIYDVLIYTGFDTQTRTKAKELSFEDRKNKLESNFYSKLEITRQIKEFESIQQELKGEVFIKIEESIQNLELFYDLCSYKYLDMLVNFNSSFSYEEQEPHFLPQKCEDLLEDLQNFYYVSANIVINASLARAIMATIATIPEKANRITEEEVIAKLKKIATILNKIITKDFIKMIVTVGNLGEEIKLQAAISNATVIQDFIDRQKTMFDADTNRLELEHENNMRLTEINAIFEEQQLLPVVGYNDEINILLQKGTPYSLQFMQPLRIVKSFLTYYIPAEVKAVFNDILVEGDFAVPAEKADFSACVYNLLEIDTKFDDFEKKFNQGACFDRKVLVSYINTSKINHDSSRLLGNLITDINNAAKELISESTNTIFGFYNELQVVLEDARKISPTMITNVRMLLSSMRNKEAKDDLDRNLHKWKEFFDIMRHYTEIKIKNAS